MSTKVKGSILIRFALITCIFTLNQVNADPYIVNMHKINDEILNLTFPRADTIDIKFEIEDVTYLYIYNWSSDWAAYNKLTQVLTLKEKTPPYFQLICVYNGEDTYKPCGYVFVTLV